MYYIKSIMNNNIFKILEYFYYFSLVILFILYLYPGSLIGYLFYGNLSQQPDLISNPIGTSINHLISFICLSSLAFIVSFQFLLFISILLEILHYFIPNRAFEYYDLFANFTGVAFTYLLIQLILKVKKKYENI